MIFLIEIFDFRSQLLFFQTTPLLDADFFLFFNKPFCRKTEISALSTWFFVLFCERSCLELQRFHWVWRGSWDGVFANFWYNLPLGYLRVTFKGCSFIENSKKLEQFCLTTPLVHSLRLCFRYQTPLPISCSTVIWLLFILIVRRGCPVHHTYPVIVSEKNMPQPIQSSVN